MRSLRRTLLGATLLVAACGGVDSSGADGAGGGDGAGVDAVATVDPDPAPMAVEPDSGPLAGGNDVAITGMRLAADAVVIFGGDVVASTTDPDGTVHIVAPPSSEPGPVDLIVYDAHGYGRIEDAYTYNPLPTITGVTPGSTVTGGPITVTGTGFAAGDAAPVTVTIGGAPCTDVTIASDTELTCTAAAPTTFASVPLEVSTRNGPASTPFVTKPPGDILVADGRGGTAGGLYAIDPSVDAPTATRLVDLPFGFTGLAFTGSGVLFGTQSTNGAPTSLYRFDPTTHLPTVVAPLMNGGSAETQMPDLTAIGEQLYAWSENGDNLTTVDSTTGAVVHDVATARNSAGSGTVARRDGTILFMPGHTDEVAVIDLAAHTNVLVGTLTGRTGRITALTYHRGGLFGTMCPGDRVAGPPCQLVLIDETTWAIQVLADLTPGIDAIASSTPGFTLATPPPPPPPARSLPAPRAPRLPELRTFTLRGQVVRAAHREIVPVGARATATSCRGERVEARGDLGLTPNQRGQWKLVDRATGKPVLRDVCTID